MENLIVLGALCALLVIGALVGIITKLINKRDEQESEMELLSAIENGEDLDIALFEKVPVKVIARHTGAIIKANVEILQEHLFDEEMTNPEILEIIDKELSEINSLENEEKKELVYELLLSSCNYFDLETWTPVIVEILLCINQEERYLIDTNNTYNLMVDITLSSEEFASEKFSADCLELINQEEDLSAERKAELEEILNDFVYVIEEELKQEKAG